jgi:hypothetical protein
VKRALVIGAAATLIWVAVANSLPAKQARAADWSRVKTIRTASGIAATYPRSWTAFARGPTTLAIASFPMPREWPDRAHKRVPDGSVYILLWSYGRAWGGYPAGTRPFELSDEYHGYYECNFKLEGYRVLFTLGGQAMQAMVALGRGARESEAIELLDRLEVGQPQP